MARSHLAKEKPRSSELGRVELSIAVGPSVLDFERIDQVETALLESELDPRVLLQYDVLTHWLLDLS